MYTIHTPSRTTTKKQGDETRMPLIIRDDGVIELDMVTKENIPFAEKRFLISVNGEYIGLVTLASSVDTLMDIDYTENGFTMPIWRRKTEETRR